METEKKPTNAEALEAAKAVIEAEKQTRAKAAWDKIEKILTENKCSISVCAELGGQNVPIQQLLALKTVMFISAE